MGRHAARQGSTSRIRSEIPISCVTLNRAPSSTFGLEQGQSLDGKFPPLRAPCALRSMILWWVKAGVRMAKLPAPREAGVQ